MCGKDLEPLFVQLFDLGSPPHVRERHQEERCILKETRITPACAGKTFSRRLQALCVLDHPRMCGKDVI